MDIYIKGMKKPKSCDECPIVLWGLPKDCNLVVEMCPIVEIKEPHGKLIDADEMIKDIRRWENHPDTYIRNRNKDFIYYLEKADAVIEAEVEQ